MYKNATAFIYLSLYEGFGIPPLEAMSFGCPVILSDITVFREIYGDAALYVDPLDEQKVSNAIKKIIEDKELRTMLISRGHEIAKKYTWEKSAKKLYDFINS